MSSEQERTHTSQASCLSIGHHSYDIHIGSDGQRSEPIPGGASIFTALTVSRLTGKSATAITSSATGMRPQSLDVGRIDADGVSIYADPDSEQTVFEDWIKGDERRQRLVCRAPAIEFNPQMTGVLRDDVSVLFACPLLDELSLDCRSRVDANFACLIPQGWFRIIVPDGSISLRAPDTSAITGPWDLIVISEEEDRLSGDLTDWRSVGRILAVTKGSRGATVYTNDEEHHVEAVRPPVVVDTTGAGDVWAAAFTVRYLETEDAEVAGRFASAAAAICVSRQGLDGVPRSRKEVEYLLSRSN